MILAVVRKDVRQHFPLLIGAGLLSLIYCSVDLLRWPATVNWFSMLLPFFGGWRADIDTTPPIIRTKAIFMLAGAYGLALGLLQGLADARGTSDFFLHRPCSRARLAVAKLLAGTLIFWVPGLIAIVICAFWSALGSFASPFRVEMVAVPLISWWTGYAVYLAAVNCAWRPGRWYGSRLLPLVAAMLAAGAVLNLSSFALVLVVVGVFTVIFWMLNTDALIRLGD